MVTSEISPPTATVRRATGRAPGSVRAALLVVEGRWTWYRRNWRATIVSSVLTPVLYLFALGLGLGSQMRPGAVPGGLSYLEYLAPALLAMAAVQTATFESTYPVLSSFKWSKIYWGITATPVTAGQLVSGQLLWIACRLAFSGAMYLVVAAAFGGVSGPGTVLSLLFATLAGMAFSAPLVAYVATIDNEGQKLNTVFRFILMPMTLFAGTFFPVSQLPVFVQPLAWITPLWHGTELSRGAAQGTLQLAPAVGHLAFLVAMVTVGALLARWRFRIRLAV